MMTSNNLEQAEIYAYLQPIVSGCGGFIKSNGYMVVLNNELIMMSEDRAVMSVVHIQPLSIVYIARIKEFINAKKDPSTFFQQTKFMGSLQVLEEIENKFYLYHNTEHMCGLAENVFDPIFQEEDMFVFPTFREKISSIGRSFLKITNGGEYYYIPVSKAIFPINKDDQCSLKVFKWFDEQNTRVFKYEVYKKKLKLVIHIYTKQFVFNTGG